MKDIVVDSTIRPKRIRYNGKWFTVREFAEETGIAVKTINLNFQKQKDDAEKARWLKKKLYLKSKGLSLQIAIYEHNGVYVTAPEIAKSAGCLMSTAYQRGMLFEKGKMSYEDVLSRSNYPGGWKNGKAEWKGLSGKKRETKLEDIPSPTSYEYDLIGTPSTGPCITGTYNGDGHQRY